jgi:hypothetical protein
MEDTTVIDDKEHLGAMVGAAAISTSQAHSGLQSLGFSPTSGGYVTFASPDFNLGGTATPLDFCLEAWVYLDRGVAETGGFCGLFDSLPIGGYGGRPNALVLYIGGDNHVNLFSGGAFRIISPDPIPQRVWTHIALTREASAIGDSHQPAHIRLFINGLFKGETANGYNLPSSTDFLNIGVVSDVAASNPFQGFLDDIRVTIGQARYTENFTPPDSLWDGGVIVDPPTPSTAEILPYNPSLSIRERFTWSTSHILTWSAEERLQLRELPAYSADYSIKIFSETVLDTLVEFYKTNQTLSVRVPMWSSPAYIRDVAAGDKLIPLSPSNPVQPIRYLLQVGMEVIVWLSPTVYELHVIESIDAAGARLVDPLANSYTHCYFLVCLTGFISGSSFNKSTGGRKVWNFTFTSPSVYIEEYPFSGGFDTFDEKALVSTDFTTAVDRKAEIVDSPLGLQAKIPMEGVTRRRWNCGLYAREFVDIMTLKRKLAWFRGKARSLQFPYDNLRPGETTSICLADDSVTFSIAPKYQCSTSVSFMENLADVALIPFSNGYKYMVFYDWDAPLLLDTIGIYEAPAYLVDGHVVIGQVATGIYQVIRSSGNFTNPIAADGKFLQGAYLADLPNTSGHPVYTEPVDIASMTGVFFVWRNSIPEPW